MKKLVVLGLLLIFIVVGLGAFTRLSHSGLGCPDWPGCYGFISSPDQTHEVTLAQSRFPDHYIESDKGWIEMIHRYAAGLALILVSVLFFIALQKRSKGTKNHYLGHVSLILGMILLQAAFGMWTVTLKLWPQVVTAHLLGGFTTFTLLYLLFVRLNNAERTYKLTNLSRLLTLSVLMIVILQISLGGWVASNYAAVACPDIPTCHGQWLPQMNFQEGFNVAQTVGPNYLGGQLEGDARTAIHFTHRIGAIITFFAIFAFSIYIFNIKRVLAIRLILVVSAQCILGIANIIFQIPIQIAVAHNLVALILLISMAEATYLVFKTTKRGS